MASFLRRHLNVFIGLAISAAAVYLSLRKIDFAALWVLLRSVDYRFLLPAVAGQISCFFLKGNAWRYLLIPAKKSVRLSSTTMVLIIGLMVNNIFPAKMGELARGYLMGERENLSKTLCLSTVAVEHLLDILILTLFLLILIPYTSLPPWLETTGILVGAVALAMVLFLFLAVHWEKEFMRFLDKFLNRLPEMITEKIHSLLSNIFQGARAVTGRYIFYASAGLLSMWLMAFSTAYLVLVACGLSLPFKAAVMVIIFAAFGKIIPSSPGAIGTFHYLVILVLMSFQISKEVALGCAIVIHAVSYLIETSLGIALVFTGGLSLMRITRRAEESL